MQDELFTISILQHRIGVEASVVVAEREGSLARMTGFSVTSTVEGGEVTPADARALLEHIGVPLDDSDEGDAVPAPRWSVRDELAQLRAAHTAPIPFAPSEELAPEARPALVGRPEWKDLRKVYDHRHGVPKAIAEHYGVPVERVYAWLGVGRKAGKIPPPVTGGRGRPRALTAR